ncbi:MAG: hypothetical protein OXI87_09500 [Albidovulum sp.]|nr:hypothetical protein [Albidovulum sp.]
MINSRVSTEVMAPPGPGGKVCSAQHHREFVEVTRRYGRCD